MTITLIYFSHSSPHFRYKRIRSVRVLGCVLDVFILERHLPHLREIETSYMRLSVGGYVVSIFLSEDKFYRGAEINTATIIYYDIFHNYNP